MLEADGEESEVSLKNIKELIKNFVLAVRKIVEDCIKLLIKPNLFRKIQTIVKTLLNKKLLRKQLAT